jgi:hypothetical protein
MRVTQRVWPEWEKCNGWDTSKKIPFSLSRIDCSSFTSPTTLEVWLMGLALLQGLKNRFRGFFKPCRRRPSLPPLVTGRHPRAPLDAVVNVLTLTVLVTERVSYLGTATESPWTSWSVLHPPSISFFQSHPNPLEFAMIFRPISDYSKLFLK